MEEKFTIFGKRDPGNRMHGQAVFFLRSRFSLLFEHMYRCNDWKVARWDRNFISVRPFFTSAILQQIFQSLHCPLNTMKKKQHLGEKKKTLKDR